MRRERRPTFEMSSMCLILPQVQIIFQCINLLLCYLSYLKLNWTTSLNPKLGKKIGNTLMYLHKNTPDPWISGQMKINKSEATCLDFSCCRNYLLQCTVLSSEKEMISLPLIGYPIQHYMVGIVFNCLAAAKVLLTLEARDPTTSQLLTTGCLCSEVPEGQLLDHVPKWSDCCIDRIFLEFNFAQTSFSAKCTPREGCG